MIPFVTEELWQKLPWPDGSDRPAALIEAPWPEGDPEAVDDRAEGLMDTLQDLISQVRRLRKEYGVPESAEVQVSVGGVPKEFEATLASELSAIRRLARVGSVDLDGGGMEGAGAHAVLRNGMEIYVPLEGVIDLERERERLKGEIQRLRGQLKGTEAKLENQGFLEKAPEEVIAKEREKATSFQDQISKLQEKLSAIEEV
jgi:valyl-tRNA synthetase